MTINELIKAWGEMGCDGSEQVRIEALGGMRGGKGVKATTLGFDWDRGSVLLHPEVTLTIAKPKEKC